MRTFWLGGLTALFLGCGGTGGGSFSFSCDTTSGGNHSCTDLALTGSDMTQATNDCTQAKGGTIGAACSHTGAVGGCKVPFTGYGGSGTTTTWYYSGTASTLMSQCTMPGPIQGTWVTP